jgi:hypothetical protein
MKIRSLSEFEAHLDEQFGWRKREITTLSMALKSARQHQQDVFFRSGVVLLYAHWEGLIRFCAKAYLVYVINQGSNFKTLQPCFLFFAVKSEIENSGKVNLLNFELFDKTRKMFTTPLDAKFNIDPEPYISTKENQNLNASEFRLLIGKLGLRYLPQYELREKLIDEKLMHYRNTVAHGGTLHGEISDPVETFELLVDKILDSLRLLRDQLTEGVSKKLFLASLA